MNAVKKRRPATPPTIANATYLDYLGSGGFADVYLYQQQIPHREVAIKVLRRGVSERQRELFRAETNLMARMSSHPAVVPVHGAGETEDGRLYIIMEYCPPPHLGKRLSEHGISVSQTLEIGVMLAGAVESLHRQGIVHRDIKPSNILMTQYQAPVLTDFGIATHIGDTEPAEGFSVPWAPPEQATGEGNALPSMDVYSLAATIYTLLAGHSPFEIPGGDNSEIAMINRVLRAPLPPINRSDVPGELERTLRMAMAKNPTERYSSVLEFATALRYIQVVQLGQRSTDISVLAEEVRTGNGNGGVNAESGERETIAVDDEATRAAARTILPHDDETRIAPRRLMPHEYPGKKPEWGGPSKLDSYPDRLPLRGAADPSAAAETPRRDAVLMDSSVVSIPYDYPAAVSNGSPGLPDTPVVETQVTSEDPAGNTSIVKYLVSVVIVLVIVVGTIYFFTRGTHTTIKPEPKPSTVTHTLEEADPVVGLKGVVDGDFAEFTWSHPGGRKGDTFLYYVDQVGTGEVIKETKETMVRVPKRVPETCLVVMVKTDVKGVKNSVEASACVTTQ